jgi:hypothetical protein
LPKDSPESPKALKSISLSEIALETADSRRVPPQAKKNKRPDDEATEEEDKEEKDEKEAAVEEELWKRSCGRGAVEEGILGEAAEIKKGLF